jgi:hypothetical protein
VQVHCDEGVAIHIDPESCTGGREAAREALTGVRTGQPLSRERRNPGCRRCLGSGRQHDRPRYASARPARRGRRPWHVRTLFVREPGDLGLDHRRLAAPGPCREGEEP